MSVSFAPIPQENLLFVALRSALGIASSPIRQTVASVQAALAMKANPEVPLPYIDPKSKHFRYAVMIAHGYDNAEACEIVECSPRTAERWRRELCAEAVARYGFKVEYHKVARDIVDSVISAMQEPRQERQQ